MDTHSQNFKVKLGLFIIGGIAIFFLAIFIIGKQKNMFDPVFKLRTTFYNVSGLQVGNNVRFSGVNIGTVDQIRIINDTTVLVEMLIKMNLLPFIKTDCEVGIGSEGLIGDKLLIISQGSYEAAIVKKGQRLNSSEPVEIDGIISSLQITANNAEIISQNLAEIMQKINNGNGTLGRLITDTSIAENLDKTVENLRKGSKGLDDNMQAVKGNILFKGYYKRKAKAAEKRKK